MVAIIEVDPPRAEAALKAKLADPAVKASYEGTALLTSVAAFKEKVDSGELKTPKSVTASVPHNLAYIRILC